MSVWAVHEEIQRYKPQLDFIILVEDMELGIT